LPSNCSRNRKRSLIEDGGYVRSVNAVLVRVPNASPVEEGPSSFGYLIYAQTGSSVTKRIADTTFGDTIILQDAKLNGHKGVCTYHQNIVEGSPAVAVIGEYSQRSPRSGRIRRVNMPEAGYVI
jgi:hypothetical protein